MTSVDPAIFALWACFWAYWFISAAYEGMKGRGRKSVKKQSFMESRMQTLLLLVALALVVENFQAYPLGLRFLPGLQMVWYAGIALTVIGLGFAVWARIHLGSNWSGRIQIKEGHQLIKTGPYALVRHPIYSGITLGIIGSAVATGTVGGLIAIPFAVAFSLIRIRQENGFMREAFGAEYDKYSGEVKAYVPGVW